MANSIATDKARAALLYAVVCPSMAGRTEEKIARGGLLAAVD